MEFKPSKANNKELKAMENESFIKLAFLGDFMLGGEFISHAERNGLDLLYPFQRIESYLSDADIIFLNLEGPIYEGDEKRTDVTSILSNDVSILNFLNNKKLCVLNLANNHIMDYGKKGLEQTVMLLKRNRIYYVGAGNNIEEANKKVIIELKNRRLAFLAYTSNEPHVNAIISDSENAGCASFLQIEKVLKEIQNLKRDVDIICISLHWGFEYFLYPSFKQVEIAHLMADAGANFIIGHHPHVIQGIEKYNNCLVMYSLGNFFMPAIRSISGRIQLRKKVSKKFILIRSEIDFQQNITFDFLGGKMNGNYLLTPLDDHSQETFSNKMSRLSKPIHSNKSYEKAWLRYKEVREKELKRESLMAAFKKLLMTPRKELIKTITFEDIRRNVGRLLSVIFGSK